MVAGFARGIDCALLFVLKKFDEFRDGRFVNAKSFLTWMIRELRMAEFGLRTFGSS
jgi:hypothetical protein